MDLNTKQARFEMLLNNYAVSLYLTYQILDSGLLEKKIKVVNTADGVKNLVRQFLPGIAYDIRRGDRIKARLTSTHPDDEYFESSLDIAHAYFTELGKYGSEWEYADLQDLFDTYRDEAEKELEEARNKF